MSLVPINDPYSFPGTHGKSIEVRTNLFKYSWKKDYVGISGVEATRTRLTEKRETTKIPPREIFKLLKQKFLPDDYIFCPGYSNEDTLFVYSVPPFKGGPDYSSIKDQGLPSNVTIFEAEEYDRKHAHPCSFVVFKMTYHHEINTNMHPGDSEPEQFLKKVVLKALGEKNNYIMIKNRILAGESSKSFLPVFRRDFAREIVTGIRLKFHPDLSRYEAENDKNVSLVSINTCSNYVTRTNVQILQYFALVLLGSTFDEKIFNPECLRGQRMNSENVDKLQKLVEGLEVYIDGTREYRNRKQYYTMIEIPKKSARFFNVFDKKKQARVPINEYFSRLTKRPIILPDMNPAILRPKGKNKDDIAVPLEMIFLSDQPKRIRERIDQYALNKATMTTNEKFSCIDRVPKELDQTDPVLSKIVMEIDPEGIYVHGRLLDKPAMSDRTKIIVPYQGEVNCVLFACHNDCGKTNLNMIGERFLKLLERFRDYGLKINKPVMKRFSNVIDASDRLRGLISDMVGKESFNPENKTIFFITIDDEIEFKGDLKRILLDAGYLSQFITKNVLYQAVQKKDIYAFNLAIKVNAKLGGIRILPDEANE